VSPCQGVDACGRSVVRFYWAASFRSVARLPLLRGPRLCALALRRGCLSRGVCAPIYLTTIIVISDSIPRKRLRGNSSPSIPLPQRYHNPVSLSVPSCTSKRAKFSIMRRLVASCLLVSVGVLKRDGLRIRRPQVRVLPSALSKVLQMESFCLLELT
jgi:hypothetical protein